MLSETTKSKAFTFGLLGCGGLILLAIIAMVLVYFYFRRSPQPVVRTVPMVMTGFSVMKSKGHDLAQLSPFYQPSFTTKLEGKIAIVETFGSTFILHGFNPEFTALVPPPLTAIKPPMLALAPEQINSVIKIACTKGIFIGFQRAGVSSYARNCQVSLIDYQKNVIFAQQQFTNSVPEKYPSLPRDAKEYIVPAPYQVIDKFIARSLPVGFVR